MVSRRTFLAGVALAPVAGCVSIGDGGPGDGPTSTTSPTGTPTDAPTATAGDVAVHDIVVRKAVTYESIMGSGGVLAAEGEQYVVGAVSADRELSRAAFDFEAGGESWPAGVSGTAGGSDRSFAGRGSGPVAHADELDRAFLVFAVPSPLSATDPTITFSGDPPGEWELPEGARERLAAPEARFELASLSVPDEVTAGETLDVTLEARNVSETDGRFLAALYWPTRLVADDDESTTVEREIAAGEVATISRSIDTRYTDDEDRRIDLRLEGHVEASREVRFRTR